eukprot:Em0003g1224a
MAQVPSPTGAIILLSLFAGLSRAQPSCVNQDAEVLILGAGMSGIAAARTLHDRGLKDFLILEGRSGIGGRMRGADFAGVKIELGANWIMGVDPDNSGNYSTNPLLILKHATNLSTVYSDLDSTVVYNSTDGLNLSGWFPRTPLENYVDWHMFDFCEATPPENVSLVGWSDESTFEDFGTGNLFVTDQRGFGHLVEYLAQPFLQSTPSRLLTNTTVTSVEYSSQCVCANVVGTAGKQNRYCGKYAISTFSIGVLQSDAVRFTPSLPPWKTAAIFKYILPLYLKVFIEFNETFWDDNVQFIGRAESDRENYTLFLPLGQFFKSRPHLLLVILTGNTANRVTYQDISITKQEIRQALTTLYGNFRAKMVDILIPDWASNRFYSGSFSNPKVGATPQTFVDLAAPIGNLYFSGEATSRRYYGFVHGAYFSGIESANAILNSTRSSASTMGAAPLSSILAGVAMVCAIVMFA